MRREGGEVGINSESELNYAAQTNDKKNIVQKRNQKLSQVSKGNFQECKTNLRVQYLTSLVTETQVPVPDPQRGQTIPKHQSVEQRKVYYRALQGDGLPCWLSGKESTCQCRRHKRRGFDPWIGKIPWRRKWQLTPLFQPGKSHAQRSREGYSPRGHKQSDTLRD